VAVPYPNCTFDIWENTTPAPGVGPTNNGVGGAILRPFYPLGSPQSPIPGYPLFYRVLIDAIFFRSPIFIRGDGTYNYNCFLKINPPPFLIPVPIHPVFQVFRIIAISPITSTVGLRYWHAFAIYWGTWDRDA